MRQKVTRPNCILRPKDCIAGCTWVVGSKLWWAELCNESIIAQMKLNWSSRIYKVTRFSTWCRCILVRKRKSLFNNAEARGYKSISPIMRVRVAATSRICHSLAVSLNIIPVRCLQAQVACRFWDCRIQYHKENTSGQLVFRTHIENTASKTFT